MRAAALWALSRRWTRPGPDREGPVRPDPRPGSMPRGNRDLTSYPRLRPVPPSKSVRRARPNTERPSGSHEDQPICRMPYKAHALVGRRGALSRRGERLRQSSGTRDGGCQPAALFLTEDLGGPPCQRLRSPSSHPLDRPPGATNPPATSAPPATLAVAFADTSAVTRWGPGSGSGSRYCPAGVALGQSWQTPHGSPGRPRPGQDPRRKGTGRAGPPDAAPMAAMELPAVPASRYTSEVAERPRLAHQLHPPKDARPPTEPG